MINCRKETVKLLNRTFTKDAYSNILLDNVFSENEMSSSDKRFITTLYYGVVERKITLDHIISSYSSKGINKLDMTILNILRTGIYQIKYMDSVPDNAAVNEAVKLVRNFRLSSASGFVNAVLRRFIRDGNNVSLPSDKKENMSVSYSVNKEIVDMLCNGYGDEFTHAFLSRSLEKTPVYLRHNSLACDEKSLFASMGKIKIIPKENIPMCFEAASGNLTNTDAFKKGYFHVQDISSQFACMALDPLKNQIVLDLCSAPGGKAFTIAQLMENTGTVYAFDIHEHRVKLISDGASRLGLHNIKATVGDACTHDSRYEGADKILCDVPCSGVGVIRKKPEIRYKTPESFDELPELQYTILKNAASYLKVGGELVYSTCTLNRRENDDIIDKFLSENKNFEGVPFLTEYGEPFGSYKVTLGSDRFDSDGFFISKIRRKE